MPSKGILAGTAVEFLIALGYVAVLFSEHKATVP